MSGLRRSLVPLVVKRKAYKYENEVRIVYIEPGSTKHANGVYTCKLEPREIIDQVMVDGRVTYQDFLPFKRKVMKLTGLVEGQVTRSLLYEPLKEFLVEVP